ncbi:taurine catabolism dioxygenase [Purpureocillium lavendulum]|uniref:Taurine catabolism dioxygenase n=1 Tax=Purpureocillium lavendulum TaxID=1247861 RepID=A0AB34FHW5_9HYPO|nr:taurine catabolism dioxygenase [Purpureocillium lavendulum]
MYNNRPHPLLEQVPLTVSPFISLPSATTLSYNYKTMPSNIPPSSLGIPTAADDSAAEQQPKARFIVSGTGHAASPEEILESCHALLNHVTELQKDAERDLREFEERIKERELAEKRRVAPGWLDSESRLLEPERTSPVQQRGPGAAPMEQRRQQQQQQQQQQSPPQQQPSQAEHDEGAELDRAFGGMGLKYYDPHKSRV